MESVKLKLKILGEEYALKVDNKALTEEAGKRVQAGIQYFQDEVPDLSAHKYPVLAAIQLAEKNIELEKHLISLLSELERLNNLIEKTAEKTN